jgi:hypothetical protein
MKVSGGCHCGAVRFTAEVPAAVRVDDCNCSICAKAGFLHLIVPHEDFVLEGEPTLSEYIFNTGAARHLFCPACGVKSFYQPRSHPDAWSVNWRCLDDGPKPDATIVGFDGRNWEAARSSMGDGPVPTLD